MKRIFFCLLLSSIPLFSFSFDPITQDFTPRGRGNIQSFRVRNDSKEEIAVKIYMMTREMEEDGTEVNQPADSLFLVFPRQVIVPPESIQIVRVQWKGESSVKVEKAYRIVAEQLPVDFSGEEKSSGIKVLFRYVGAVYILPEEVSSEVVLSSWSREEKGLQLNFYNNGNGHCILSEMSVTVNIDKSDGTTVRRIYSGEELAGLTGENILARSSRHYFLPLAESDEGDIRVSFEYEAER